MITIYTDGSAWPNPGPGGWAAIINGKEISGSEKQNADCNGAKNIRDKGLLSINLSVSAKKLLEVA